MPQVTENNTDLMKEQTFYHVFFIDSQMIIGVKEFGEWRISDTIPSGSTLINCNVERSERELLEIYATNNP